MLTTETATRFHLGLHVSDLDRSVRFYRVLLGVEPTKHLADYARFESERPPLVIALYPSPQPAGGTLNHAGLRFPDSAAFVEVQRRLEEVGIATQRQEGVECCYRMFDEGKSRYTVSQQMKISFAAATHRFNQWRKAGGAKRQKTLLG